MQIVKDAVAGTLESSDLMVKVSPNDKLDIVVQSLVLQRFGKQIRKVIADTLTALEISQGSVVIDDKGALDCVIKARVQAAVLRGADADHAEWEKLS